MVSISGKDMDVMLERYAKVAGLDYTAMNQSANALTRGDLAEMVFFVYALSYLPVYSYSTDVVISNEFGDMPGVLTVYPMAEEWSLTWSTPFFPMPAVATGWYSQRFDYAEMESAGVLDGMLNFRDISDIVTNGIQKLYDPHLNVYPYMLEKLPGMFQDGTNSCWVDYLWGMHTYESWVVDLYNSLQVFFQLDEPGENPELQELAKQGKLH